MTLVEILIAVAVSSILALVIAKVLSKTSQFTTETSARVTADIDLRTAMNKVETLLLNANSFTVAAATSVVFRADRTTDPAYDPDADADGDGIPGLRDPDDDGDAVLIKPPTAQWETGYDLKDDDDDGDHRIDMQWKIYLSTPSGTSKTLFSDYSKNEEAWGLHVSTVLAQVVSSGVFHFYGSENDVLSPGATSYDMNGDGLVTETEIDSVVNGGDGNGRADTSGELNALITVSFTLDRDSDHDGTAESSLTTEVMPPGLYLKRRP